MADSLWCPMEGGKSLLRTIHATRNTRQWVAPRPGRQRLPPVALDEPDVEPESAAVLARDRQRRRAALGGPDIGPLAAVLHRQRDRAAAGAEIDDGRPGSTAEFAVEQAQRPVDER